VAPRWSRQGLGVYGPARGGRGRRWGGVAIIAGLAWPAGCSAPGEWGRRCVRVCVCVCVVCMCVGRGWRVLWDGRRVPWTRIPTAPPRRLPYHLRAKEREALFLWGKSRGGDSEKPPLRVRMACGGGLKAPALATLAFMREPFGWAPGAEGRRRATTGARDWRVGKEGASREEGIGGRLWG
jgi:hypothetical protein